MEGVETGAVDQVGVVAADATATPLPNMPPTAVKTGRSTLLNVSINSIWHMISSKNIFNFNISHQIIFF